MGIMEKFRDIFGIGADDDDMPEIDNTEDEDNIIKPSFFSRKNSESRAERPLEKQSYTEERTTITSGNIRRSEPVRKTVYSADIRIAVPTDFEDSTSVIDDIKGGRAVILNTTKLEIKTAQRLLDFVSGAVYALKGEIKEIMEGVYVISPENIRISDDITGSAVRSMFGFR